MRDVDFWIEEGSLSTYDERIAALEKDATTMKHDITYKLDETNSAVTIIKGVMGLLAQDMKVIKSQIKTMDFRLEGIDVRLARVEEVIDTRLARVEEGQDEQGQDIKEINQRLETQDKKLDQVLGLLATLTAKTDK